MLRCGVVCRFFIINRTAGYGTSCGAFSFRKTETAAVLCILVRLFFFFLSVRSPWSGGLWCGAVWCGGLMWGLPPVPHSLLRLGVGLVLAAILGAQP